MNKKIFKTIGNYTFEVRNVKFYERMSKETMCYTGILYINDQMAAEIMNDGQGGCANIHPIRLELINEASEHIKKFKRYTRAEAEKICKNFNAPELVDKFLEEQCRLYDVCDDLANDYILEEEIERAATRFITKHQNTCLCFEKDGEFYSVRITSVPMNLQPLTTYENGIEKARSIVSDYESRGYHFINNNIAELI